jgi:hypothetical protein
MTAAFASCPISVGCAAASIMARTAADASTTTNILTACRALRTAGPPESRPVSATICHFRAGAARRPRANRRNRSPAPGAFSRLPAVTDCAARRVRLWRGRSRRRRGRHGPGGSPWMRSSCSPQLGSRIGQAHTPQPGPAAVKKASHSHVGNAPFARSMARRDPVGGGGSWPNVPLPRRTASQWRPHRSQRVREAIEKWGLS